MIIIASEKIKKILVEILLDSEQSEKLTGRRLPQHDLAENCLHSSTIKDWLTFHEWNKNHLRETIGDLPMKGKEYIFIEPAMHEIMMEYIELYFFAEEVLQIK